ncbi:MAG: signal recognition particle-docking protein FtsY [Aquiluna sp.]
MFKFLKRLREKVAPNDQIPEQTAVAEVEEAPREVVLTEVAQEPQTDSDPTAIADPEQSAAEETFPPEPEPEPEPIVVPQTQSEAAVVEVELPKRSLADGIRSLFSSAVDLEDLEDILLLADFGVDASVEITEELKRQAAKTGASSDAELRLLLKDLLVQKLKRDDAALNLSDGKLPYVFLVVGVNGAGKTTTIGKLTKWLRDGDWHVVVGAADTFRAAAVDQIATWVDRAGAKLVRPEREGQDPASVAYQTVEQAIAQDADIAIIDTAGRLQNKKDLMDELGKIRRAVEKQAQINEVLLVIDATTGQNAINQAKAFTEVANVTGIVMTKLDGTAKGGILYTIQSMLDLPVKLVGVGEGVNDFAFFDPEEFAKGLVAYK